MGSDEGQVMLVAGAVLVLVATSCSAGTQADTSDREYPHLTPWALTSPASSHDVTLGITVRGKGCIGTQHGSAPVARVDVHEYPDRVVVGAYLGKPPETDDIDAIICADSTAARVELDGPLGTASSSTRHARNPRTQERRFCSSE